ncbi:MAG: potassium channel protein [Planctomycetota bacterium]
MSQALSRARQGALVFGFVFVVSTVGFHWISDRPLLESLYWTTITISGVGYGQEVSDQVDASRQAFSVLVILLGMFSLTYTLGMLIQAIVEGQIEESLGVRRMCREIEKLQKHTIVCGFGRIGRHLSMRLSTSKSPFVLIDSCPEMLAEAKQHGYLVVEGNATDEEALLKAGIMNAESVVVALNRDADNVYVTLTASNLNKNLRIVARGEHPSTEKKLLQAGATQVVLPAVIGAERMAEVITRPQPSETLRRLEHHSGTQTEVEEFAVTESSVLNGLSLSQLQNRLELRSLVVAVRKGSGEVIFNPDDCYELEAGDHVVLVGPADEVGGLLERVGCEADTDTAESKAEVLAMAEAR